MWGHMALALLAAHAALQLYWLARLKQELAQSEREAQFSAEERRAERAGRTKAERELRELQLRVGQLGAGGGGLAAAAEGQQQEGQQQNDAIDLANVPFPLRPVGVLRSVFSRRNGTPRQPLLVPAARAELVLRPGLSADFLEGLRQYSHCWVVYIFHANTDLQRLWQQQQQQPGGSGSGGGGSGGVRAKIRVPRLDGERLGVFATRSPHRPCPIGLSVAEVVAVEGNRLVLGGADIVDGTPVLDIKPYLPFCDAVPAASAPDWVAVRAAEEPLNVGQVHIPAAVDAALEQCWQELGARSLYRGYQQYRDLVVQALSRDIRSVTQRVKVPRRTQAGGPAALCSASDPAAATSGGSADGSGGSANGSSGRSSGGSGSSGAAEGHWHVVLNGIELTYDVDAASSDVVLKTAAVLPA